MSDLETKDIKDAEERVINNIDERSVVVCGTNRTLRPLPSFWTKRLHSILNKVSSSFQRAANASDEEKQASPMGGQENLIAEGILASLTLLAEVYKWAITSDDIDKQMTIKEQKEVVQAQISLNSDQDFLLIPWQIISGVLSATTETVREIEEKMREKKDGQAPISQDSQNTGTQIH